MHYGGTILDHSLLACNVVIRADLAAQLLQLARHENLELWEAFNGSFKGQQFTEEGIEGLDTSFFLLQARDIARATFKPTEPPPPSASAPSS
jgi:hypothetical protein